MFKYTFTVRVRYSETDQMGVVYHGNYVPYLEIARVESLRSLGISYKKMEQEGIMLPVVNLNINFKKPAFYDDELTLVCYIKERPSRKFVFEYDIFNSAGEVLVTAHSTLVFVDAKTKRSTSCPHYILDKLDTYLG